MCVPKCIQDRVAFNAIRMYAALSYLYYEKDESPVSDGEFDKLCAWLQENWDWVKQHDLNGYLSKESLAAGTGFDVAKRVCGQTKEFAESLLTAMPKKPKKRSGRSVAELLG